MNFQNEKNIKLKKADIHLHYANNRGRGTDNVTITVVEKGTPRPVYTRKYKDTYIEQYRVSGWKGRVNVPVATIKKYDGLE